MPQQSQMFTRESVNKLVQMYEAKIRRLEAELVQARAARPQAQSLRYHREAHQRLACGTCGRISSCQCEVPVPGGLDAIVAMQQARYQGWTS